MSTLSAMARTGAGAAVGFAVGGPAGALVGGAVGWASPWLYGLLNPDAAGSAIHAPKKGVEAPPAGKVQSDVKEVP